MPNSFMLTNLGSLGILSFVFSKPV